MVAARPLPVSTYFETRLQAALEQYLRVLRERIPSMLELNGALPSNFWIQEEKALATALLPLEVGEPTQLARAVLSIVAPRVNELLDMEAEWRISLEMLRYELRIGPLSDARAERLVLQQAARTLYVNLI